jgi:hypothetical protein
VRWEPTTVLDRAEQLDDLFSRANAELKDARDRGIVQ